MLADRPISGRKEDLLGRSSFAEEVARSLAGWSGEESLTVAVCGPWGSGKSSVKSMVVEVLRDEGFPLKRRPQILEFNPWQISARDQISAAFFREIGACFGRRVDGAHSRTLAAKWVAYAAIIRAGTTTVVLIKSILLAVMAIAAYIGLAARYPRVAFGIGCFLAILVFLSVAFPVLGTWLESVGSALHARSKSLDKPLADIKRSIAELLRREDTQLLVVIDDVDRLSADEVRTLFQLIKAHADFPNLTYLLFYDRVVVERCLEPVGGTTGRDYLKKLVQVELDLPRMDIQRLETVLFARLDAALNLQTGDTRFDELRWQRLFVFGLRPYFRSLRDVYRFMNTLEFHLGLFRGNAHLEVNPVDLIGVEVLRIFEPHVYRAVSHAKDLLTGSNLEASPTDKQGLKSRVESLVGGASAGTILEILKELFPAIEWSFDGMKYGAQEREVWLRNRRVSSPAMFDRYFVLSTPMGELSEAEFKIAVDSAHDRTEFRRHVMELSARGLLQPLVRRLTAEIDEIALSAAPAIITSLCDIGDELPKVPAGTWELHSDRQLWLLIRRLVERKSDATERSRCLRSSVEESSGLHLPLMALHFGGMKPKEDKGDSDNTLLLHDDLESLKRTITKRIHEAADSGRLRNYHELPFLLYRWLDLSGEREVRSWVERFVSQQDGLIPFLASFVHHNAITDLMHGGTRIRKRILMSDFDTLVSTDTLDQVVLQVSGKELSEADSEVIEIYRKARRGDKDDEDW